MNELTDNKQKIADAKYYQKNKEKIKKKVREYYFANKEKIAERKHKWYLNKKYEKSRNSKKN